MVMNIHLLKEKLNSLENLTRKSSYFTEYDSGKVERILERFFDKQNISKCWSSKRKGYVIECPGHSYHTHKSRIDDCVIFGTKKANGFIWISAKCRHSSCWGDIMEYLRVLNRDWGQYLNNNYTA